MKQKTEKALKHWLAFFPESYHECDMDRFHEVFNLRIKRG